MLVVGLTGGIAAGKTTAAGFFAAAGLPVFDADACVHRLYAGEAVAAIADAFPDVAIGGSIDRQLLGARVGADALALRRLEGIVHPLVRREENRFLDRVRTAGARAAVVDVPLLLETEGGARADIVVVASAPIELRRQRALARGMPSERFDALAARQLSDEERARRSHFVIGTGGGLATTRQAVVEVLRAIAPVFAAGPAHI